MDDSQLEQHVMTSAAEENVTSSSESIAVSAVAADESKPYPWIIHPAVDILFCCGVFPIILWGLMLAGISQDPYKNPMTFSMWALGIIAVHLFQDAHGVASWHRILTHKETMSAVKPYFITITVIAALAFVPLLLNPPLLLICFRLYFLLGAYHWLMQSYGVSLIYLFKRGYMMNPGERRLLLLVFQSICAFVIVRILTIPAFGSFDVQKFYVSFPVLLPGWAPDVAQVCLALVVVAFLVMVGLRYLKTNVMIPVPVLVLLATTLWVYALPAPTFWALGFFIGAFYHGSQSWCVTTSVHCKIEGLPPGVTNHSIWKIFLKKSTWLYLFLLFVISELIFTVAPRVLVNFGPSIGVAFATVVVIFSTHHFLCDSAIWKLKDPKVRALLVR